MKDVDESNPKSVCKTCGIQSLTILPIAVSHVTMTADKQTISQLAARFARITGPAHVLTETSDMAAFLDEPREKFHGRAAFAVRPRTTDEVSAIMALASQTRTAIVPQGGNTGLVGGQVPDGSGAQVIVSLLRMNAIRQVSAAGNVLVAEAGCTLQSVQQAADDAGRLFPLSLAAEGSCTIGGNLSTNAGGINVVAYGNARDLCLGLEVVLADGRIWNGLNLLRKNNTGVDLKHLFIGSEGTLGIITAAALKLFPAIHERSTAFVAVPSIQVALDLFHLAAEKTGHKVTSVELIPQTGLDFTIKEQDLRSPLESASPWYVLLEISTGDDVMESLLETALERHVITDAVIAQSSAQREALWALRELLPESQKPQGGSIKHDVSLPLDQLAQFLDEASAAVTRLIPGARPVPFGHIGDGNIHFNITQPEGADKKAFLARWGEVNALVHDIVLKLGGSISAEHGIGQLKHDLMPAIKSPVELDMMAGLKHLFDPLGILNPGKLLPEAKND